ncbi:unnamed protein product [Diabrotica balteata]|uniref:Uncharacterized protein n=1 Tax=Diabrotica balteata TaxID=107213 RepID=A0A9N9T0D4_DIABA|nr:unnamed protein product [Diabrotica balteata]
MNVKKTKFMRISKNVEKVDKYAYLGTIINSTNDYNQKIKIRIEKARANFNKMTRVLCTRDLKLELRVRFAR